MASVSAAMAAETDRASAAVNAKPHVAILDFITTHLPQGLSSRMFPGVEASIASPRGLSIPLGNGVNLISQILNRFRR